MIGIEPNEKFIGFGKYLEERKKAGVINLINGDILYIFPPGQKGQYQELNCYIKQRNSQQHPPLSSPQPKIVSSSTPAPSSTDFLSNLLDKVRNL